MAGLLKWMKKCAVVGQSTDGPTVAGYTDSIAETKEISGVKLLQGPLRPPSRPSIDSTKKAKDIRATMALIERLESRFECDWYYGKLANDEISLDMKDSEICLGENVKLEEESYNRIVKRVSSTSTRILAGYMKDICLLPIAIPLPPTTDTQTIESTIENKWFSKVEGVSNALSNTTNIETIVDSDGTRRDIPVFGHHMEQLNMVMELIKLSNAKMTELVNKLRTRKYLDKPAQRAKSAIALIDNLPSAPDSNKGSTSVDLADSTSPTGFIYMPTVDSSEDGIRESYLEVYLHLTVLSQTLKKISKSKSISKIGLDLAKSLDYLETPNRKITPQPNFLKSVASTTLVAFQTSSRLVMIITASRIIYFSAIADPSGTVLSTLVAPVVFTTAMTVFTEWGLYRTIKREFEAF